jgi:hypothetical protein
MFPLIFLGVGGHAIHPEQTSTGPPRRPLTEELFVT